MARRKIIHRLTGISSVGGTCQQTRNAQALIDTSPFLQKQPVDKWVRMPLVDVPYLNHPKHWESISEVQKFLYEENQSCIIPIYKPVGMSSQTLIYNFKKKFGLDKTGEYHVILLCVNQ